MNLPGQQSVNFQIVLDALVNRENPFPPTYLHRFSDLDPKDLTELEKIWAFVPAERRIAVMKDLEELAEADTLVSFYDLAKYALDDDEAQVRVTAIGLLWEEEDKKLIPLFIRMMESDSDSEVRAAAATILGNFVYLGEIEELPSASLALVEKSLVGVVNSQDQSLVRRRALESLGFSSRHEVPDLLRKAYNLGQPDWIESALLAMGRSSDDSVWDETVLANLDHTNTAIQLAAIRAAGELSLEEARIPLLELLADAQDDDEIWSAAIWSLSQIGGEDVRPVLEKMLDENEDDDEITFLEEALDNLSFTEDMANFGFIDFDAEQTETHLIELDVSDEDARKPKKRGKHSPSNN